MLRMLAVLSLVLTGSLGEAKTLRSKQPTAEAIKVRYEKYWKGNAEYYAKNMPEQYPNIDGSVIISISKLKCQKISDPKDNPDFTNWHQCSYVLNYGKEDKILGSITHKEELSYVKSEKNWSVMGRRAG